MGRMIRREPIMRRLARTSLLALLLLALQPTAVHAQPARENQATGVAAVARVRIVDFAFRPRSVTIAVGDVVVWKNTGPSQHTTTSDSGVWDSGVMNVGATFRHRFNSAGVFSYHCSIHTFMTGRITVTGS
jgi:plastocyanin